jgi:hypothetical protein
MGSGWGIAPIPAPSAAPTVVDAIDKHKNQVIKIKRFIIITLSAKFPAAMWQQAKM